MTPQEIVAIITLARRAPLANMAEAEAAAQLLQKLAAEYAPKPAAAKADVPAHSRTVVGADAEGS